MEDRYKFLEEYKVLCEKYGLHIDGCGCCGSPFLSKNTNYPCLIEPADLNQHMEWLRDE